MAADDIYRLQVLMEGPQAPASIRVYYQEDLQWDGVGPGTRRLAQAWDSALSALLRDMIADDWKVTQIHADKVSGAIEAPWRQSLVTQDGVRVGPSLPSNNAMLLGLQQGLFPPRSNGRLFIPGAAEGDTTVGTLDDAFVQGAFAAFRDVLIQQLAQESGGAGRWTLGVISVKVLNLAPPFKDWEGAFSPVFNASTSPVIATQRRRQTKVRGLA